MTSNDMEKLNEKTDMFNMPDRKIVQLPIKCGAVKRLNAKIESFVDGLWFIWRLLLAPLGAIFLVAFVYGSLYEHTMARFPEVVVICIMTSVAAVVAGVVLFPLKFVCTPDEEKS